MDIYGFLIWPMRMLGWLTNMLSQSKASQKKIDAILAIEPEIRNSENAIVLEDIKGNISFENVTLNIKKNQFLKILIWILKLEVQ